MSTDRERCNKCGKVLYHNWREASAAAKSMRLYMPDATAAKPYRSKECGGGVWHVGERHAARNGRFKWVNEKRKRRSEWEAA